MEKEIDNKKVTLDHSRLHKSRNISTFSTSDGSGKQNAPSRKQSPRFRLPTSSSPFKNIIQHSIKNFQSTKHRQTSERGKYSMRDAIEDQRYDIVQLYLQGESNTHACDPNEEIPFFQVYMTGLEYSVYTGDWKMAILFFLNSADPSYNCFDGTILEYSDHGNGEEVSDCLERRDATHPGRGRQARRGTITSRTHRAFSRNDMSNSRRQGKERSKVSNEITGFDGLYCLVNPRKGEPDKVRSSLWLMSRCHDPELCPHTLMTEKVKLTRKHLLSIGTADVWNAYFEKFVFTSLLCIRCRLVKSIQKADGDNLPNDVLLRVLEYIIDDILSETIRKALLSITDQAVNVNEAQDL